jgi:DNA-directed RNA polymerase subunit RPC12/RpoP
MSDSARDLLVRGIAAARAGEKQEARFFLEWVLRTDADRDQQIDAWYYLSQISDDPAAKRECLENVLVLDPSHPEARRGFAILDGRLDPAAIIDPDRPDATPHPPPTPPLPAQRFVCHKCGGKLAFSPDGQQLTCTYCHTRMTLYQAVESGAVVREQDFAVALATAKGHAHPVASQSLTCHGCGVSFLMGPATLSLTCPYCGSAYVVQITESRTLVPPEGVIPFAVNQDQALAALQAWLRQQGQHKNAHTSRPNGLYLPAWTFDVGGEVQWRGLVAERRPGGVTEAARTGGYPIFYDDLLVPATHTLPSGMTAELHNYQLPGLAPYDPGYLADWPAEVYQISVADASLVARRQAWEQARETVTMRVSVEIGYVQDLVVSSAAMMIESYKLILLPVWVAHYRHDDTDHTAMINGQTGCVHADSERGGLLGFLDRLF